MMRENIGKYHQKDRQPYDLGSHFGASCMADSRPGAFFLRPVFRNLWGVPPWTNFGLPWVILDPTLSISCKISRAKLVQNSKIPEQHSTNHTFNKNKQGFPNNFTDNQFK
jgi:hypothetical protein